ncbi:1,4-dihydroxy-2-naphthoyl-CoA synthase [Pseudonocardia ailaonensis]|uniref:1,4-dihydroxy-2-naphthoyl-CoA synthase n=1 Tax=Pseudonocardia ailaonensis TaxID=367279 RepID=A0ABN2NGV0_9PSEU
MPDYSDILYKVDDGVATVTINREQVRNAFRLQTLEELRDAVLLSENDTSVGVIVITGAGDKAFCAGGDINMESASGRQGARELGQRAMAFSLAVRTSGKPVVARVNGWCIGGGNEINLICDLSVAAESARFGQSGPKMGSVPIWWGTQLLPRLVGDKRAKEIVFLCQQYTAAEAKEMGWINRVVPDAQLDDAVDEWCRRMLTLSPQALRVAKHHLNMEADRQWPSIAAGYEFISFIHGTDEFHEGAKAFLEKRPPAFDQYR